MLKQEDIHIGKLLRYDLHTNVRQESFIVVVTDIDTDGFWINFHDGDKTYVWYKYDLGKYEPLEIK
tara:strand:- start:1507 stop:1704 length:198 start_codon:yes stop_codon:yes gene_type:complete